MKKIFLLVLMCTLFTVNNANAASYRISPYVGLDVGMNISADTSLFSIVVGGKLHTNFGLEASYTNYGKSFDISGFALDLVGYLPTSHVIFLGMLGYGMQSSAFVLEGTTVSTGVRVAGGIQYRFTRNISGRALARYSMLSNHNNPIDASVGVSYSF